VLLNHWNFEIYGMRIMHDFSWSKHGVLKLLVPATPNAEYI